MSTVDELGPIVRLWGLTTAQLPSPNQTPDELAPFLISILQEAVPFVDSVAPKKPRAEPSRLWKAKGQKSYKDSAARVQISERVIPTGDLDEVARRGGPPPAVAARYHDGHPTSGETWICRRSLHEDAAVPGTAAWAEFRRCFKEAHAETEDAFTPTVVGAREAATWDCGSVEAEEGGETWGNFTLKIEEMRHKIGKPLKDRTFPVLQMTCSAMARGEGESGDDAAATQHREKPEFLVVSVTVADFDRAPNAEYSRAKDTVLAAYASVERIRKLPATGEVEWIMATASDARGVLPQWVQNMAVPGQVAKDVPLFLGWIARERNGEPAKPAPAEHVAAADPQEEGEETEDKADSAKAVEAMEQPVGGSKHAAEYVPHGVNGEGTAGAAAAVDASPASPKSLVANEKQEVLTSHATAPATTELTTE